MLFPSKSLSLALKRLTETDLPNSAEDFIDNAEFEGFSGQEGAKLSHNHCNASLSQKCAFSPHIWSCDHKNIDSLIEVSIVRDKLVAHLVQTRVNHRF